MLSNTAIAIPDYMMEIAKRIRLVAFINKNSIQINPALEAGGSPKRYCVI